MRERSQTNPAVSCQEISVRYGDFVAADRVSFEVNEGEVFGLLGPNGAGKTSIIRALTTILQPSGGTAWVAGSPLSEPMSIRLRIGVLPESNGYPNRETAIEYLTFYAMLFGVDRQAAAPAAAESLQRMGLTSRAHHRIGTFSRGMRQRLGLARAMVSRPRVLFLDEPTLGLDPSGKEDVLGYLSTIAARGTTILLSSHLLDDVERVCDRVAIMDTGRIVSTGSVSDVARDADVGTTARVALNPADVLAALNAVQSAPFVAAGHVDEARRDELVVQFRTSTDSANQLATVLLRHDIPFRSIELRGARLSDAFLALTSRPQIPA